jgi:zinc transport system permease protein
MLDMPAEWLDHLIYGITTLPWPTDTIFTQENNVRGVLAVLAVCFICGAMGSLVVGNRMAFFSDALAHCAFAGVGLGLLLTFVTGARDDQAIRQQITLIMVCFGVIVGLLIAFVRDQTNLASDTVIGVFFAGAMGLGALIMGAAQSRRIFSIENFIFGDPVSAQSWGVVLLIGLGIGTGVFLYIMYNWMVLASANPSLALSRQVPVRLCRYLFIVMLALMVNMSQQIIGTLLINGLLIVPAASAANLARNLRQMFWYSILIALLIGFGGYVLSWEIGVRLVQQGIRVPVGGTIIVLSVVVFAVSAVAGRWLRPA